FGLVGCTGEGDKLEVFGQQLRRLLAAMCEDVIAVAKQQQRRPTLHGVGADSPAASGDVPFAVQGGIQHVLGQSFDDWVRAAEIEDAWIDGKLELCLEPIYKAA